MTDTNSTIDVPDRYDVLLRRAGNQLVDVISPVEASLEHVDALFDDVVASSRGTFLILKGASGSGKSTFIHTIGLFRQRIETHTINKDQDIDAYLNKLDTTSSDLRIVALEGREALTDVSSEVLEKAIHAINHFVRTPRGERTIITWLVNRDDLAQALADLATEIGAEALVGLDHPVYQFEGPPRSEYLRIANHTIALLNDGATIHDLGISEERAEALCKESNTIGIYLARIRRELLKNQRALRGLDIKERPRMWVVVVAGDDPDSDVDGLTRGTLYSADVDRMLSVTGANVVADLRQHPEKLGLLGTYFDARILHFPMLAALEAVRTYASDDLKATMRDAGMTVTSQGDAIERMRSTNLYYSFENKPIRARRVGKKPGSNSKSAFEKLAGIASDNDVALNRAIGECLKAAGVINSFEVEQNFGDGLTRRTDIVAHAHVGKIRLEMMWRKATGRADIANYALSKLYNYGRAIGYLD